MPIYWDGNDKGYKSARNLLGTQLETGKLRIFERVQMTRGDIQDN